MHGFLTEFLDFLSSLNVFTLPNKGYCLKEATLSTVVQVQRDRLTFHYSLAVLEAYIIFSTALEEGIMDIYPSSSRSRTIDLPKPDTGLAEWTSKIKAMQRQ